MGLRWVRAGYFARVVFRTHLVDIAIFCDSDEIHGHAVSYFCRCEATTVSGLYGPESTGADIAHDARVPLLGVAWAHDEDLFAMVFSVEAALAGIEAVYLSL
jgi:hypothetical protein